MGVSTPEWVAASLPVGNLYIRPILLQKVDRLLVPVEG